MGFLTPLFIGIGIWAYRRNKEKKRIQQREKEEKEKLEKFLSNPKEQFKNYLEKEFLSRDEIALAQNFYDEHKSEIDDAPDLQLALQELIDKKITEIKVRKDKITQELYETSINYQIDQLKEQGKSSNELKIPEFEEVAEIRDMAAYDWAKHILFYLRTQKDCQDTPKFYIDKVKVGMKKYTLGHIRYSDVSIYITNDLITFKNKFIIFNPFHQKDPIGAVGDRYTLFLKNIGIYVESHEHRYHYNELKNASPKKLMLDIADWCVYQALRYGDTTTLPVIPDDFTTTAVSGVVYMYQYVAQKLNN